MADNFLGGFMGNLGGVGNMVSSVFWIIAGLGILGLCGFVLWWFFKKKRNWNMLVEIKIPRSEGGFIGAEWGKGEYNSEKGVVWIKRKGKKPVAMKPFNPTKYLQGEKNILTVLQLSPGYYIPVLPNSYFEVVDDKTQEEASILKLRADYSESRSWKNSFEREAKQAFSIKNLLYQYAPYISIGLVILLWGIQFMILYSKVT